MPTAVRMQSIEKTMSSSRIWTMAAAKPIVAARPVEHVVARVRIDGVVDLVGRLPDQEQAAGDQDQVAPGEAVPERP